MLTAVKLNAKATGRGVRVVQRSVHNCCELASGT